MSIKKISEQINSHKKKGEISPEDRMLVMDSITDLQIQREEENQNFNDEIMALFVAISDIEDAEI